jgi:uncharacterized protein YjbI with pentapeptide repeats
MSSTREQINLSEQGQITDRYTKAIDQLGTGTQGDAHLQTRLGGIYALERLAHDSPRDQPAIIEILSAFIRSALPTATGRSHGLTSCPNDPGTIGLAADVLAALFVLGRRDHTHDNHTITDLRAVCLTGVYLSAVHLDGANLSGADLSGAGLTIAQLAGAYLIKANLSSARLTGADLTVAQLEGANLTDAQLDGADLKNAQLSGAQLDGANLTEAQLEGADLTDAVHDNRTITAGATKFRAIQAWW